MNVFKPLRRLFPANRPPAQTSPGNAPPKGRVLIPPRPVISKMRHARVREAFGSSKRARNGFHFLPFFAANRELPRGYQRLSDKLFSRPLLPAGRRAPRRPVASGARRSGFDGTGHPASPPGRRCENEYRTTAALSRNCRSFCRREDRRRFHYNSRRRAHTARFKKRRCAPQTRRAYTRHYDGIAPLGRRPARNPIPCPQRRRLVSAAEGVERIGDNGSGVLGPVVVGPLAAS